MQPHSDLTDRQRAFLLVSFLVEKEKALKLIAYLPPPEQGPLGAALEELQKIGFKEARIADELRRLSLTAKRSPLIDTHPDWLLEALKQETPRTIATILRHLPGQQVSHILAGLPESKLKGLPPFSETFSLDPELVSVLRRRFEQAFRVPSSDGSGPVFGLLKSLPAIKLELLFRELGFAEAVMAFGTLNEKTVGLILRRLSPRDAAMLKSRLSKKIEVEEDRMKQAQTHILSVDLEKTASNLILELGFFVASKAALPQNRGALLLVARKFSLREGNSLLKYVERNLPLNSEKTTKRYENEILQAMDSLEGEKKSEDKKE